MSMSLRAGFVVLSVTLSPSLAGAQDRLQSSDLLKLRSVSSVEVSPDGTRVAYTVENNDGAGRPYSQLWVMTIGDGKSVRFGGDMESSSNPEWSPDGQWLAYRGRVGEKAGLIVARPDGTAARFLAEMSGTNSPLPTTGRTMAWSPDGRRIAFVSSTLGPETADATGDPIVITRYLYKPDAAEGLTRFNDNRRLHIFVVEVASGAVKQLTDGTHYEHSIDWSPNGDEIAFVSNREPNEDQFFNQYEQMEWGVFPHQGNLMDTLLQRSAIRHVANAHTPTLLMHGENDNDVPIAEAEQYYVALRDVGTEAVMVRYPREGHGIRESKHVVDSIDRSIRWYEQHFPAAAPKS
jgi:dipeptidyl aminopeptidase/acylaminoacyl peptidase